MDDSAEVRALYWSSIRELTEQEAKAALLEMVTDLERHWENDHLDEVPIAELGIAPDEYLIAVIDRVRHKPPPEAALDEPSPHGGPGTSERVTFPDAE